MRPIRLDLDSLTVSSFDATPTRVGPAGAFDPVPDPTDVLASCSECSLVGIPCCTQPRTCPC